MKRVLIYTVATFGIITLITSDNEGMSDGVSSYGFPQTFYSYTGGKTISGTYNDYGFVPFAILIDIPFAAVVALIIIYLGKYLKNIRRSKTQRR